MDPFQTPSGRTYQPLPLPQDAAFPVRIPVSVEGMSYIVLLYPSIPAPLFATLPEHFTLSGTQGYLVMNVATDPITGDREVLLIRKVVLGLEYDCGPVFVTFPDGPIAENNLRLSPSNFNGTGTFGTRVIGGISAR